MANITAARLIELEHKERLLDEHYETEAMREFTEVLCGNLGVLIATTPRTSWPRAFERAFEHARRGRENAAGLWLKRLPG